MTWNSVFKEPCIPQKQCKVQTLFLLNSAQYQEMSCQESLILEHFRPWGKQVQFAKKRKCVFYSTVCCCQHDSDMLGFEGWNREGNMQIIVSKGFFKPTLCHWQLFSLGRQGGRQILSPQDWRRSTKDGTGCLNPCFHTSLSLEGKHFLREGLHLFLINPVPYAGNQHFKKGATFYNVWCLRQEKVTSREKILTTSGRILDSPLRIHQLQIIIKHLQTKTRALKYRETESRASTAHRELANL